MHETRSHGRAHRVHITFICTGNICRSPMAERIIGDILHREGLDNRVRVSSAGIGDWHVGNPADHRTVDVLRNHGYSADHVAAVVDETHLSADLIVALDSGHARELAMLGAESSRVRMLRSFDPDADSIDVADPYYGGISGFEEVRQQIEAAVPGILRWVRDQV
ncbi:low molecular weight protein-tyrosine-phosphatase [Hoyosella rhizosphaerae]|nr:low molecular weight protein-tyrosine-phosphatase [Hoyosella rhizosphaerae]